MMIKRFEDFIKEEVNGTELIGPMGPGYGETGLQNKTVNAHDTTVIFCDLDSNNIYGDYLKNGGKPLDGFSLENIIEIIKKDSL